MVSGDWPPKKQYTMDSRETRVPIVKDVTLAFVLHRTPPSDAPHLSPLPADRMRRHSSDQMPRSRIASYIASGARSAPLGHCTAPETTAASARNPGSLSGSN